MLAQDVHLVALIMTDREIRLRPAGGQADLVGDGNPWRVQQMQPGPPHAQEVVRVFEIHEAVFVEKPDPFKDG